MARIFIVDDHPIFREALAALVEAWGYRVVGQDADPSAALHKIQQLQPDLVLLDLVLGGRSGLELLEAIKRRELSARVLVLTVHGTTRHVAESIRLGAQGMVLKGDSSLELRQAMAAVIEGRSAFAGKVAELAVEALAQKPGSEDRLETLSLREKQVLGLVVNGHSSREIGEQLHLSPKTVDSYRSRLMAKLGVGDLPALVRFAVRAGLVVDEVVPGE